MRKILYSILLVGVLLITFSCEDYLDKSPESDLDVNEVFKNFNNSQGFVEQMYAMVVDRGVLGWNNYWLYGEETYGQSDWLFTTHVDRGNYWAWTSNTGANYFTQSNQNLNAMEGFNRNGIWDSSWAGIRIANVVLSSAEELMVDATQQEIDAILGQAYFFRAYFHLELMQYWGRLPYVDVVFGDDDWRLERPETYKETALAIDKDFEEAAKRLPDHWDDADWVPGQATLDKNTYRVTKGAAYAFKGKNLLWAASPLMQEGSGTYDYDEELCTMAVDAFAKVINNTDRYGLTPFANIEEVFYPNTLAYTKPSEFIFSAIRQSGWTTPLLQTSFGLGMLGTGGGLYPTHNYIYNYFGMADGMACEDSPNFNPSDPWVNRDPRFHEWIVVDGDMLVESNSEEAQEYKYANFYSEGNMRGPLASGGTRTGYLIQKWAPKTKNKFDNGNGGTPKLLACRLTDVYLMYAEAALNAYGINGTPSSLNLSALGAINALRERVAPGDDDFKVNDLYLTSENKFMDEIRRERAVELAYEGCRWTDVRRWLLGTDLKYKRKTEILFDRNAEGKPINFQERDIIVKIFDDKHNWLPFKRSDVEIYEGFEQNPGW